MKETEKDNIKQIYTNYLSKEQIQCNDQEEIDKIIKYYKETGETIPGYNIESDDLGNIIVWKDTINDRSIDELKAKYQQGGLGDVKIKKFLFEVLNEELAPVREKRKYYEEHIDEVIAILKKGTEEASAHCDQVVDRLRRNMKINYFDNDDIASNYR